MKKILKLNLLITLLFINTSLTYAYRPFSTEDAGVAGKKVSQLELSYDYMDWDTSNKDNVFLLVPVYGMSENLEISFELPFMRHIHSDDSKVQGLSDANIVLKYLFANLEKKNTFLTLKTLIKLDNGNEDKGLGSGDKDLSLVLAVTKEFSKFSMHSQLGYTFVGKNGDENIRNINLYGLGIDYSLNDKFCLAGEISGQKHPDKTANEDPLSALLGLIYKKNEKQIFDIGIKRGLNNASAKINLTLGYSLTF